MSAEAVAERKRWMAAAAVVACMLICAFARLGSYPLIDPDESRYAQAAREMMARGDYMVPYLDGEPRINKPPLLYWLIIASYRAFGENEFAARFPSACAGLLAAAATFLLARSMYGAAAGAFAAAVLSSMTLFAGMARLATTDCLMSALLTWALYLWWRRTSEGGRAAAAGAGAALGLAFLAKGPVAVALFALVAGLDALAARRLGKAPRPAAWPGVAVLAAITVPWPIAVAVSVPGAPGLWWRETIGRFVVGVDHPGSVWFPLAMTAAGAFPWYLMALSPGSGPGAWLRTLREDARGRYLMVWAAGVIVFFTACRSQLATYVLPAFPPIAAAAGAAMAAARAGGGFRKGLLTTAVAAGAMGAALLAYGAAGGHFSGALVATLASCLAGTTVAFLALYARRLYGPAAVLLTAAVAASVVFMTPLVLGKVAQRRSFAEAARAWGGALRAADVVLFAGEIRHSIPFYSGATVRQVGSCEEAAAALASRARVAVIMREDVFRGAEALLTQSGRVAGRHAATRKPFLLLTNFDPEGGEVSVREAP